MAPKGPMLLPKGIVLNTNTIYDSIARYDVLPPETMHQCWKIYTTTHRKLHDPTARRLENCWWRIWGSNCRYLKGEIVADVYRHISTGPTVVPIKGPENRWEPGRDDEEEIAAEQTTKGKAADTGMEVKDGTGSTPTQTEQPTATQHPPQPPPAAAPIPPKLSTDASGKPRPTTARTQSETTHAAPVPLHPILKKSSQSSGKKQVTRFAPTPTDSTSAIESDVSSGSTATAAPVVAEPVRQASVPPPKKKHVTMAPTKRYIAVKKRPVLPRRQSSQSSTGSDVGVQGGAAASQRFAPVVGSPHAMTKQPDGSTETLLEADEEEEEVQEAPVKPAPKAVKKPTRQAAVPLRHPLSKTTGPVKKAAMAGRAHAAAAKKDTIVESVVALPRPSPPNVVPEPVGEARVATTKTAAAPTAPATVSDNSVPRATAPLVVTPPVAPTPAAKAAAPPASSPTPAAPTAPPVAPSMPIAAPSAAPSSYTPTAPAGTSVPTEPTKRPPPARVLPPQSSSRAHSLLSKSAGSVAPLMGRSQSHQDSSAYRPGSRFASLVQQPTATMSDINVQGILLDLEGGEIGAGRAQQQQQQTARDATAATVGAAQPVTGEYEKHKPVTTAIGTPPMTSQSRAQAPPMTRTKSHLQLLLEKGGGSGSDRSKRNSRG